MEWYDFAVYGYFASVIGQLFFPNTDPAVSLIASFGAFAAGFVVRPLGGLLFGRIGDRIGRERAMTLSVVAMAVPTVLMAFIPSYQTIGILAPILIIFLRIVQGLSVGGEFTSSLVYLVEHAPSHRRGFMAIWGSWGASAGTLLGSAVGLLVTHYWDSAELLAWGWRLPFLLGGFVAFTGYWIRKSVRVHLPLVPSKTPVKEAFARFKRPMLRVAFLNVGNGVAYYTAFIYTLTYLKGSGRLSESDAFQLNTVSMVLLLCLMPLSAWLSDWVGRKPVLLASLLTLTMGTLPLFYLILHGTTTEIILGELSFALILGFSTGAIAATNVELIPSMVRCTGLAFAYNASIGLFGGSTPMINAWLIRSTESPMAPAFWGTITALVSLLTLALWVKETRFRSLDDC
jgi:MHS family proline/betaine transporter-like MFS transporter